jgi:uncharacterized protein (DUF433 family)
MVNWPDYIVSDKGVLTGKPSIQGTRLSVELIMGRLANGWSEQDIFDSYPRLTREALNAVYAYAFELMQENLLTPYIPQRA